MVELEPIETRVPQAVRLRVRPRSETPARTFGGQMAARWAHSGDQRQYRCPGRPGLLGRHRGSAC